MTLPLDTKREFLDRVAMEGNVSRVCRELGLNRSTVYEWRGDQDFAVRWDAALEMSAEGLREQVLETARHLGLGRYVPALDDRGRPVLDDNFEPVMRLDVSHVDVRVLSKLIDKTLSSADSAPATAVQVNVGETAPTARPRLVFPEEMEVIDV
jgi:hypothetical protein